jgi:hypothetical protein
VVGAFRSRPFIKALNVIAACLPFARKNDIIGFGPPHLRGWTASLHQKGGDKRGWCSDKMLSAAEALRLGGPGGVETTSHLENQNGIV